jgi:hypothetical protein
MISGAALSALAAGQNVSGQSGNTQNFLELKTWRLHTSDENQSKRVSEYLEHGLFPALRRAGAFPVAALGNLIGENGPYLVTVTKFSSLGGMQDALGKMQRDADLERQTQLLSIGTGPGAGVPFVRIESSLLQCFNGFPDAIMPPQGGADPAHVFELRTYESQTLTALRTKVGMFEGGEIGIFQRLGMKPVFFGETIVGVRQPCITYMLSFDSLAEREKLWSAFGSDPEWKRISAPPPLKDAQIVGNISNVMLRPLAFSPLR